MYLSHLSLTNFRNFLQLELDLPQGVVVFFGGNAQGKTSLLEAIYLLAIARSFRAEHEHEVVNWGVAKAEGTALVAGSIEKRREKLAVRIGYQCIPTSVSEDHSGDRPFRVRREIRVSRIKRTAAELVGMANAVLFSADDIQVVQGPPSLRRRFLDILLSQVDPSYLRTLQRYQRVLQHRNRLLRMLQERRAEENELGFWDEELAKEGSRLETIRLQAMRSLAEVSGDRHRELTSGAEDLALEYLPSVPRLETFDDEESAKAKMLEALEASRRKEMAVGSTVVGPHRDDFRLTVNGADMRPYASRGQARTAALSLRLAEAAYLASSRDEGPIVLLDDVLSEMDSTRRSHVLERALQYQQVIISTTDLESVRHGSLKDATYFQVEAGNVSSAPTASSEAITGEAITGRATP